MELLKKIFPLSFSAKPDVASLVINVLIHLVVGVVVGFVMGLLAGIPILGIIFNLIGRLLDLYILVGIVLTFLDYFKILK